MQVTIDIAERLRVANRDLKRSAGRAGGPQ